ncbi:MAG: RNA-binding cell elongation regulator Jag/EloR [Anaerolineae bacterium]
MVSKESVEITAPSVEEATILGVTRLGITRDEAIIEVLDEGSQGFLGIGARKARVRVTRRPFVDIMAPPAEPAPVVKEEAQTPEPPPAPKPAPRPRVQPKPKAEPKPEPESGSPAEVPSPQAEAKPESEPELKPERSAEAPKKSQREVPSHRPRTTGFERERLEEVTLEVAENLFGALQVRMKTKWKDDDSPTLWLSLKGKDASALVGRRGRTLNSTQYLVRALVRRQVKGNYNLVVDADGYRRRRHRSLRRLARRMADRAVETGKSVRLRSMPARERRIVHVALRKDPRVRTQSSGSGRDRAVVVYPK